MFGQILITEFMKLKHSKITWLSWLAISIMPLVGGLFMWIAGEPGRAAQLGLLGDKAQLLNATADWAGYFDILLQITGIGGMILVSVITAFVFGREYTERTAKNLLALPAARRSFVIAKLVVICVWFGVLTLSLIAEGLAVGVWLGLPGFSIALAMASIGHILLATIVTALLVPVVAWIASLGRGYLAPLGFAFFMLVMGMAIGATGWGKWFPWSIVPLFAGVAGPRAEVLSAGSLAILAMTSVAGIIATILHIRHADNSQ
jgi:ABC-2 type transport system permease protein